MPTRPDPQAEVLRRAFEEAAHRLADGFELLRCLSADAGAAHAAAWERLRSSPGWRDRFPLLRPESIP